ncbi:MAG: thioredoxin [Gammaproteobacteria bacterium HGW-Gammaproteobacteria-11]|nr:MAG: thioredoxin [Gammaproteobacteria bacterium HGW-Gammaproteobacteria-11]
MKLLINAVLATTLAMTAFWAHALEKEPFTEERYNELRDSGEVFLVDVYATWCSTCATQQEILKAYKTANPDIPLTILEVDFDDDKEWVRHFRAPRQSTLVLYRGGEQMWFSVGETRSEVIVDQLDKVLKSGV